MDEQTQNYKSAIEALLFVSEKPVILDQLKEVFPELKPSQIYDLIKELQDEYVNRAAGMVVVEIAGGFQMLSNSHAAPYIREFYKTKTKEKLSRPALESLAIIAYKQPVGRAEVEIIRGVNSDGTIAHLLNKGLIKITGRKEVPGRPFLYGTTKEFLEYFGLKSLEDMPKIEEFNQLGVDMPKAESLQIQNPEPAPAVESEQADQQMQEQTVSQESSGQSRVINEKLENGLFGTYMDLSQLRKKIDGLDARIIRLLNDRAAITLSIGKEKIKNKKPIYAPEREQDVLKHIKELNGGPIKNEAVEAIYREIMSASLALEKPLHIAYMGPEATFSHLASLKKFGSSVDHMACDNVAEVFSKVESADCDYGVVPIENSIEGVVTHTMDLLVDSELKICSQVLLHVTHNLMSKGTLSQINEIYSHPQILGQCRQWLIRNMPKAHLIPVVSSIRAAQMVVSKKHAACIASQIAAPLYGLTILKKNIQDSAHNITRFLVISTMDVPPTGNDRTSLVFSIKDKVGALHAMLTPFMKHKINLTKIESRPSKKKAWDYYFFVDCEGHQSDPRVARALSQLEGMCKFLKILGSYPDA